MPTVSLTYTQTQATALNREMKRINAQITQQNTWRASQTPPLEPLPTLTILQVAQQTFDNAIAGLATVQTETDRAGLSQLYQNADDATKLQVQTLLGYNP